MEFLIGICTTIVGEIAKVTIAPVGRQLGYLFYYQRNIDNLQEKIEDLKEKKTSIDLQVQEAANRDEEAEEKVNKWQAEAEKSCKEAENFLNDERHHKAKCSCRGSLWSRHQLSRKSSKMEKTIASIIENANGLRNHFHRRPVKCLFENRDFVAFDTRTSTFKEIMEALEDPNCSRIGVYGIGGVGKTTLVKEVAQKAQKKGLFSDVVMVTVSQPVNPERIQEKIVEMLNLKLDEKSMEARASRLQNRLEGQGKVLLILDDIWEKLDLKEIGIYSREDGKGSKLLLVSRNQDVLCNDMNVEKGIQVRVLSEEEAMNLFNKYVGRTSDDHKFKDLATKIVGRCGRLPIAIVTIACALKNKRIHGWRDAFKKLERSPKEGYGEAYWSIRTSYDFLGSDERMILLLCSLYEEDADINVENLTSIYSAYCDLVRHGSTLQEARDFIGTRVDNLKGRSLLLNGGYDGAVRLHDVIRQIMMSIASEENNMHCLENSTSLSYLNQAKLKDSAAISLLGPDFDQLPNDLACPKLKLLKYQSRNHYYGSRRILVPEGFLEGVKEIRALCLVSVIVKPSSLSSCSLSNLTTLSLKNSVLEDIALIGELEKLVILDLSHSKFRELPEQIGKLTCLHQLNLNGCSYLKVIRPNVIWSLKQLEELYMDEVYIKWGMEAEVGGGQNADLAELVELPHLRDLHLCIFDASALPKHKLFDNENLERYYIVVGRPSFHPSKARSRKLHLELNEQSQLYECGFQRLIKEAEELCLKTVPGVENIVNHLDANGFLQLKCLKIDSITRETTNFHASSSVTPIGPLFHGKVAFPSLESLELENVDFSELWPNGLPSTSFMKNLTKLSVTDCKNLKYLFPFAIVGSFMQLEDLEIYDCAMMEEIIKESPGRSGKILFPKLRNLKLESLQSLKRFCGGEKVAFPRLEMLEVTFCWSLKYLLSDEMAGSLLQLETLKVHSCKVMEELAVIKKPIKRGSLIDILFPRLKYLDLGDLPMLKRFSAGCVKLSFPSLQKLKIKDILDNGEVLYFGITSDMIFRDLQELEILELNNRTYLLSFATVESLKLLKRLNVQDCHVMEHVIGKAVGEDRNLKKISFPKLESLRLSSLRKLECFCEGADVVEFSALLKLEIYECEKLRTFIFDSGSTTPTLIEDEQQVEVRETMTEQPLFNAKVAFPLLEKLEVTSCESLKYLLSCEMAKSLLQLESLKVCSCEILEKLAVIKEADEERSLIDISFPKLKYLYLDNLPMLKRFSTDFVKWSYPSLLNLTIRNIFDDGEVPYLCISSNMIFNNMQELKISGLNTGAYLLPFAAVESLMQLRKLKLQECNMMEHVISKAIGEDGRLKKISFPKLESLELSSLSKVECFCEGADVIECSALLKLKIDKCEKLRTFVLSSTSTTPTLTKDEQQVEVRESVTQQTLFNEKVVFSNLEDLRICYCGEDVNEIWPHQSSTPLFPKLKVLRLMKLTNLMHLFDNPENIQSMPRAVQPFETLFVSNSPGLKTLAASSYFSFKNLTNVFISQCHGMTSLLDSSTVKSLEQLTRLSITKCDQLMHVICTNHTLQDESAEGDEIVFRRLKILAFHELPSLESFHGGNNNMLELPSLERLIVIKCPEMQTFSHGRINSPKLNRSIITEIYYWPDLTDVQDWFEFLEIIEPTEDVILEGDLNRSIRKLWEENYDPHIALQWLFSETTDSQNFEENNHYEESTASTSE